ncbi:hypothetical protein [Streptomyces sp. AHA2]|uniref:hypothetical protein n=1 Tax=Streptomyces sp. AHA2 TaxID=3064526 RepID=UPI003FA78968
MSSLPQTLTAGHAVRPRATTASPPSRRAFPALCLLTPALPFAPGRAIGGSRLYGETALLCAGIVRRASLHHVTRSVNSQCHLIGERPLRTRRHDRATDLWPLALSSFGGSRHTLHHAHPTSARSAERVAARRP